MMKKVISFLAISLFLGFTALNANADSLIPGANYSGSVDSSVMGVGQTLMQFGANDRAHANYVAVRSGAAQARNNTISTSADWQFGSSQSENVWKQWRTLEDTGNVTGLVVGDCRGDNSSDTYRRTMGQNRDGYMTEHLVSNADCQKNHATLK
jgi:hypothetical protein|tara:strand:- start:2138 stop:2596 length:459 start_codon:yes stop_codon:yes gene_type:complete